MDDAVNVSTIEAEFLSNFLDPILPLSKAPHLPQEVAIRWSPPGKILDKAHHHLFFPRSIGHDCRDCSFTQSVAGLHSSLPADQIVPRAIRLKLAPRYCDWPLEADRSNAGDDLLKSSFAPSAWVRYPNF